MDAPGLYNYWIVIVLMMTGFYVLIAHGNLVKKIVGLNIFQTSVFILYALVYGIDSAKRVAPAGALRVLISAGLLLYLGVGYASLALGGDFLDYNVLSASAPTGQHLGIFLVELGVGVTVAATMVTVFFNFAGRGRV